MTRAELGPESGGRMPLLIAAGCYLLFVVYGSLVPLDYHPRPLAAAWADFLRTGYLVLGAESRADWVANILLYIPLAYLLSAGLAAGGKSTILRLLRLAVVFVFCAAVAVGVEFAQLFFPPRTVSLNDIIAELLGSAIGIGLWLVLGGGVARLWAEMRRGGMPAIRAAMVAYVLGYLAFALFPYDFLVSAAEYSAKFAKGGYGFFVAPETCERASMCAGKVVAEILAVVPLGVLLGMALGRAARRAYAIAAVCGLALGLTIETAQLLLSSGVSEGISLLTRVAGLPLGVLLHRRLGAGSLSVVRPYLAPVVLLGIPVYLAALMWANGWFSARWVDADAARDVLEKVRWLPFYYHYFSTETRALRSLLACVAMYMPVGLGYWMWTMRRAGTGARSHPLIPALLTAPLVLVIESGKLFVPDKHPDPTNVLIAMFAAAAACALAAQIYRWAVQGEPDSASTRPELAGVAADKPVASAALTRALPAVLLLGGAGVAVLVYPLGSTWPALALCAYGLALWRYPALCLPVLLALLPWLNFAPWTGWVLLNEFDLVVAVTLAVRLLRPRPVVTQSTLSAGARLTIGLLALSFFASALVGLLPLSPFDSNALASYYGSFNSLRELKGFLWALLLLPLLVDEAGQPQRMQAHWVAGMVTGLCGVVAVVLWERAVFAGLADFGSEYRVEGTFPELHSGGGDIHAYLVMAIPFAVGWMVLRPTALRLATGMALFLVASYALGVTFTRGGYIGYVGALGVLGAAIAMHWLRQRGASTGRIAIAAVLAVAGFAVMLPIVSGTYMESRFAGTKEEAGKRTRHWVRAIGMMDDDVTTMLFGMGLGTFPKTVLFREHDTASATYTFERQGANGFVRLGSGRPLYLGQRVAVDAEQHYRIALDLRSLNPAAKVDVSLCEKSAQQSFRCKELSFPVKAAGTAWEHYEATLDTNGIGSGPLLLRRPVVLSVANSQPGSIVDVDNVRLQDDKGRDLLANGDFSDGGARWYFSADDHLPWHIFNLWVQVLFEQGWAGVLALSIAVAMSLARLAVSTWRGDLFAAIPLAALCGFLLIGLTESLFDGPRVTTLFFLLLFTGLIRPAAPRAIK